MLQDSSNTIRDKSVCSHPMNGCVGFISWNAIIIPALIAVGLSFLLNTFSSGLGLSIFTSNPDGQLTLLIGGFVWLFIASYFLMFFVGWIAGDMVQPSRCLGILHAFAAWCLALIITVLLFSQSITNTFGSPTYYGTRAPTTANAVATNVQAATQSSTKEEATNKLGIGVLGIFFIFLAGALGSCTGGYVGSKPKIRRNEDLR